MSGLKTLSGKIQMNKPEILAVTAIAGVIGTAVTAIFCTNKANDLLNELEVNHPNAPRKEHAKTVAKAYWPLAIVGGMTIASIIGSEHAGYSRSMVYAGALTLANEARDIYREEIKKKFGEDSLSQIDNVYAEKRLERVAPAKSVISSTNMSQGIDSGNVVCLDSLTNRYFMSNATDIQRVVNHLNQERLSDGWIDLNSFYDKLGLEMIPMGEGMGWSDSEEFNVKFSSVLDKNNTPVLVINYDTQPKSEFYRRY